MISGWQIIIIIRLLLAFHFSIFRMIEPFHKIMLSHYNSET